MIRMEYRQDVAIERHVLYRCIVFSSLSMIEIYILAMSTILANASSLDSNLSNLSLERVIWDIHGSREIIFIIEASALHKTLKKRMNHAWNICALQQLHHMSI